MTDITNILEAAKNMALEQCLDRAAEENAAGVAEEKNADEAMQRAMQRFRNSGDWYCAARAKAKDQGKSWGPILIEHCKAQGESRRTAYDNIKVSEHWDRVKGMDVQRAAQALKSKRAFLAFLKEIDGQRSRDEDQGQDQDQDQDQDEGDQDQDQEENQDQDQEQEEEDQEKDDQEEDDQKEDQDEDQDEEEDEDTECVKQLRHWWLAGTEEDHKAFVFEFDAQLQRTMEMVPENTETLSFAEAQKKRNLAS